VNSGMRVERKFHVRRGRRSGRHIGVAGANNTSPARIPRVSRLMALAIRFDSLIRDGAVKDQAELARLGHVTRARLTQIMDLLTLAPDIQHHILNLSGAEPGSSKYSERRLRVVLAEPNWRKQRQIFRHQCDGM
jgi:hypothetical protein